MTAGNPNIPDDQTAVSIIKGFISECRPLNADFQQFMFENPAYFTDEERAAALPWCGAIGGDTGYLQLGLGWYKADGSTSVPFGVFNPYLYGTTDETYAAYKRWLAEGGVHPPMPFNQ